MWVRVPLQALIGEMAEWSKAAVLKTVDLNDPWVRIPVSPPTWRVARTVIGSLAKRSRCNSQEGSTPLLSALDIHMKHSTKKYYSIVQKFIKYVHPDDPVSEIKFANTYKTKRRIKYDRQSIDKICEEG